ncbi:unnamed protein product [Lepidochelys kempii]
MWKYLAHKDKVISYVDDILVATKSQEENLMVLDEVLRVIQQTGFLISPYMAQLVKQPITYLGVELGINGPCPDANRVDLVCKLPAPRDVSSLRSFLGLAGFSRDFIDGYTEIAHPLYALLRKGQDWVWGEQEQEAVCKIKQAFVQALAFAYPDKPFHLQLATTEQGLSTVLLQQSGASLKLVAYGSKHLSEVEKRYSVCEKEVLALIWSLQHWEYIIGMSPVVFHTTHTPVCYILSGRANDGRVSSPRLAGWMLSLLNREVQMDKVTTLSTVPSALLIQGEQHECPLLTEEIPTIISPFHLEKAKEAARDTWVMDGSSYHQQGSPHTGYAVLQVNTRKVLQGTVVPHSAQAAEIVAIAGALDATDLDLAIMICSDSDWVLRAICMARDMRTAHKKSVAHARYLVHAWRLAKSRKGRTFLFKVRAHRKNMAKISVLNNRVDSLPKQPALMGPETLWNKSKDIICQLQSTEVLSHLNIVQLQKRDEEIKDLLEKQHYRDYNIFQRQSGLVVARRIEVKDEIPVLVIPSCLSKELIMLAHQQGHFCMEKMVKRILTVGWWPEVVKDAENTSGIASSMLRTI